MITLADVQFTYAPAITLWLLVPGIIAAVMLTAILYRAQRRMAPARTVMLLTGLRLFLIAMLAVLFMQPALKWEQVHTSAGTLWLVMDQSPSMQTNDSQATPVERMRWAQAMGVFARNENDDGLRARAHALLDEARALAPDAVEKGGEEAEQKALRAFIDRVQAWAKDAAALESDVDAARSQLDAAAAGDGTSAAESIATAVRLSKAWAANMRSVGATVDQENNRTDIAQQMANGERSLKEAADAADAAYARTRAGDAVLSAAESQVKPLARNEVASRILTGSDSDAAKVLEKLAKQYRIRIVSFADKVQAADTVDPHELADSIHTALEPAGQATNLAGALQGVSEQIAPDEAASIVMLTDGRNNVAGDPIGAARNLSARGVHVFGLLVGSHELAPDAAVEPAEFPEWIFKGDTIRPRVAFRFDGLAGKSAEVSLSRGSTVLEKHPVDVRSGHETRAFDFQDTPPETDGVIEYTLRVSELPGEVNTQNNVATFRVAVKKQKLYALIIEDKPRWEYRYLAAYLSRRSGMGLQTVLLQPAVVQGVSPPPAAMASPDNPHEEAQNLPDSLQAWEKFDVIVLGDVGPDLLTPQMQQWIAAAVRDKGSTLITIAGQRAMPEKYANAPLADVLPVTLNRVWSVPDISRHMAGGFRPGGAEYSLGSPLAALDADPDNNARIWANMPLWYWHSPFTEAKPAATVVWAETEPRGGVGTLAEFNRHALLATMTVGLGHSLYLASDQSWRLRQVGGINLHDRFWGQVLNWAVGSDLPAGGKYVRFGTNQQAYDQSQPVIVTARVLKDDLTPYTGLNFSAVARQVQAQGATSQPAANAAEARFEPMPSPGYYQATLTGLPNGDVEISLKGSEVERLLNSDPTVTLRSLLIKISPSMNAERRNMDADPETLESVARAGGGTSLDIEHAGLLLQRLPKIEHEERTETQVGFFTDPAARGTAQAHWGFLLLFALVITAEWVARKFSGLV